VLLLAILRAIISTFVSYINLAIFINILREYANVYNRQQKTKVFYSTNLLIIIMYQNVRI